MAVPARPPDQVTYVRYARRRVSDDEPGIFLPDYAEHDYYGQVGWIEERNWEFAGQPALRVAFRLPHGDEDTCTLFPDEVDPADEADFLCQVLGG